MATVKLRAPTEHETEIMRRNGVDPENVSVISGDENTLVVRRHKTGDDIMIVRGLRPWGNWRTDVKWS